LLLRHGAANAGGPGCSSELAVFYENGPFHITSNLTLERNEYGWDQTHNMIFVDQVCCSPLPGPDPSLHVAACMGCMLVLLLS
jgi:hypothetical protein